MARQGTTVAFGVWLLGAGLAGMPAGESVAQEWCFGSAIGKYYLNSRPHFVTLGDIDDDGDLDMVVSSLGVDDPYCHEEPPEDGYCRSGAYVSVRRNLGDGTFAWAGDYDSGHSPQAVALGDLDGDGDLDMVVANNGNWATTPGDVSVLFNAGDGTFGAFSGAAVHYAAGDAPSSVALGDLNGDGALDIATERVVLLNMGDGSFADGVAHGGGGSSVTLGDVNGDGTLDIVTGSNVLLNIGGGSFADAVAHGGSGSSVTLGDLDGDGALDIVVANSNDVSVLANAGDGTFAEEVRYAGGGLVAALGDVDSDGDLDLITGGGVSVHLNVGDGTFAGHVAYISGYSMRSLDLGDVDGDGDLDVVTANAGYWEYCVEDGVSQCVFADDVWVHRNAGEGSFAISSAYQVGGQTPVDGLDDGPGSIAIGDLDGDGNLDVAVANGLSADVSVLLNAGDATLASDMRYGTGDYPAGVAVGDLNGDGALDLVVANAGQFDLLSSPGLSEVSVLLNLGNGSFTEQVRYAVGDVPWSVAVGDVNGDGALDIVTSSDVLLNIGDGSFADAVAHGGGGSAVMSVTLGDLNGDGALDLAVAKRYGGDVSVLLNAGDGTFSGQVLYPVGTYPSSLAIGDIDGDHDLDMVVANKGDFVIIGTNVSFNGGDVSVLLNTGDGTFASEVRYGAGHGPESIALGDIDRDGALDVVVGNAGSGDFSILINMGDGTFGSHRWYGPVRGTVALGDLDNDGSPDIVVTAGSSTIAVLVNGCAAPCDSNTDCNANGISDCDEIAFDPNLDADGNGVLDACETTCAADLDGGGDVGFGDLTALLGAWGPCNSVCDCITASLAWHNESIGSFDGQLVVEWDQTPNSAAALGGVSIGLSPPSGPTWDDYAVLVRLNGSDYFDVRNGAAYDADVQLAYTPGVTYHVRVDVDVPANTYSVWVTPEGAAETQIASDYAFRTTQQGITSLDTIAVWTIEDGSHDVCDIGYGASDAIGSCPCLADLDGDGQVGFTDLTTLIAQWGACF